MVPGEKWSVETCADRNIGCFVQCEKISQVGHALACVAGIESDRDEPNKCRQIRQPRTLPDTFSPRCWSYGGDDDEQNGNRDVLRETIVLVFAFEHLVEKLVVHVGNLSK